MHTPKQVLPPAAPAAPSTPKLVSASGGSAPQTSALARFDFSPALLGFQPRSGGRRSLLGGS